MPYTNKKATLKKDTYRPLDTGKTVEKPLPEKTSKILIFAAITTALIIIASIIFLYRSYNVEAPAKPWFADAENDVILNLGAEYPGMIDVIHAELEVNEKVLNITIKVRTAISDLSNGEYAQWNTTIILQDSLLKAYEVCAEMNSTRLVGYIMEIGGQTAELCTVQCQENSLTILAPINELQSTKEIQWYILTMFERWSEHELMISGSDIAPDKGLQRTTL